MSFISSFLAWDLKQGKEKARGAAAPEQQGPLPLQEAQLRPYFPVWKASIYQGSSLQDD